MGEDWWSDRILKINSPMSSLLHLSICICDQSVTLLLVLSPESNETFIPWGWGVLNFHFSRGVQPEGSKKGVRMSVPNLGAC